MSAAVAKRGGAEVAKRSNPQQPATTPTVATLFDLDTLQIEAYLTDDSVSPASSRARLRRLLALFEAEARPRSRARRPKPSDWPPIVTPDVAEALAAVERQEDIVDAARRALTHVRQLRRAIKARDAEQAAAMAMVLVCDMLYGGFVLRADADAKFVKRTRESKAKAASGPRKVVAAIRALIVRTYRAQGGGHGALKETARRAEVSTTTASRVLVEEGVKGPAKRNRK